MSKRGYALEKAIEIINGERQDQYGNPEDSFELIGDFWGRYLRATGWTNQDSAQNGENETIRPEEAAMMMVLLKIARETNQRKSDNVVDAAGYLGIYGDMTETSKSFSERLFEMCPEKLVVDDPLQNPEIENI